MAERVHSPATYGTVFAVLAGLTLLTVGVSFIPLGGLGHMVCGLTIAVIKAALVVLFFMHVLGSPPLVRIVILVAVGFMVALLSLSYSDYFTRDLIPFMPGH